MDTSDHLGSARIDEDASAPSESKADLPYVLIEPIRRTAPLIFASPHSGRRYPADLLANARIALLSLRRTEDAYVDELLRVPQPTVRACSPHRSRALMST